MHLWAALRANRRIIVLLLFLFLFAEKKEFGSLVVREWKIYVNSPPVYTCENRKP